MKITYIIAAFLLLLSGCDLFSQDEVLVGPYKLVATDIPEDMTMCWRLKDGGCVGDGLPGPTLFAAGFNDKYVVTAIHPSTDSNAAKPDKTVTQYFYVIRGLNDEGSNYGLHTESIRGPFTESEYSVEKARLNLPEFTRVFDDLK